MFLSDFFASRTGVILISIIWGVGLSTIFRKACEGKSCTIIKYISPNPTEVMNSTYNYGNDECYKYDAVITKCDD